VSEEARPLKKGVDARFVTCRPLQDDPLVLETRHRASCLLRQQEPRCSTCPNQSFTLFFEPPEKRLEVVKCPRWGNKGDRSQGLAPTSFVDTELATCAEKPYEFCPSCPTKELLAEIDLDKSKEEWYRIWNRAMTIVKDDDER
jgi:hypothetical protein